MIGIEGLLTISEIKKKLKTARSIAIFAHTDIDGDAIGSMLAMYEFLDDKNKNVSMFCDQQKIPQVYNFLDNVDKINKDQLGRYDLLIALDCASIDRLGKYKEIFSKSKNTINIDHHYSNTKFAKVNLILPYSSCGEIVFEIFKQTNSDIQPKVATALFTAISADTGNFSNENVDARSFLTAGELIALGADVKKINLHLHRRKSLFQLRLAGYMSTNLKIKNGVSYLILSKKVLEKLKVAENEVSQFINLVSNVNGSKMTLIMKEVEKDKHKISFRSTGNLDVRKIATIFNGGGHKNASACVIKGNADRILKKVLRECYLEVDKVSGEIY